jgi:tripartite-type tricarboxylate transporter receptor subunit TctC
MKFPGLISRRALLASMAAPPVLSSINQASAQMSDWPNQSVRFICVFPPGGGTDILSRIWCQKMSELTGQQFIVENRSGSGGNVGTEAIARARPDGYTLGLGSVSSLAIAPTLYSRLSFDPEKDFSFIGGLWQLPNLLIVNKDIPATTVPELVDLIKRNPGKYSFASSGSGTTVHLSGEMFKQMGNLDIQHVPYRGGAPAHVDLLAGRVHLTFDNIPQGLASAREGAVRALAVTSATRSPQAPEVPTMAEFMPGFEVDSWGSVIAPAGVSAPTIEKISMFAVRALESDDVRKKFSDNAASVWAIKSGDLAAFRRRNQASFAPLIRASGAVVD